MKQILCTLTLNKQFKRAYYQGRYKAHPVLVTYMVRNHLGYDRIGITTSKKIGGAVKRNRARRVIRAAYLGLRADLCITGSYDMVFVARAGTPEMKSTAILRIMKKQIEFLSAPKKKPVSGKLP